MRKVVIIQELFSSYRGPVFDRLSRHYNLLVLHGKRKSDLKLIEKPYSRNIPARYFFKKRFVFLKVFSVLRSFKPDVVIHQGSPGILSLPITWIWCRLQGIKFVLWTHGFERHQGFKPKRSFRSFLRLLYFRMADGVLFYTKMRRDFFDKILPSDKLFYATNTVDTTHLIKLREMFKMEDAECIKKELMMSDHFNIVFIGRLLKDKLADHLIKVTAKLKDDGIKVKTHIIGDGDELAALKKTSYEFGLKDDVVFYGAIFDDAQSGKILYFSDVMVMPGYIGLAINHAYCFDLPVVTYRQGPNGPFHSPEIDYLEDGETGMLVEPFNIDALTTCLLQLRQQPALLAAQKKNVSRKVEELTIEKMESGFIVCIEKVIEMK